MVRLCVYDSITSIYLFQQNHSHQLMWEGHLGKTKKDSISIAHKFSMKSIIVSGCSFFAATFGVALYSRVDMIGAICTLLARGAVISTVVVLLVLPAMFMVFDPIIVHTSKGFLPDKIFTKKKMLKLMGNIHAQSLLPTLLLMRKITQLTDCENILLSPINLCDGLAADYAERKFRLSCGHDFTEDILSASRNVAQKYEVDLSHIDTVQTLALQIFDRIKKIHGLGKRERLLLQLGVILHGCGAYINALHARECSYHILLSTEIIGISHKERLIVANMIRYNDESFPSFEELDGDFSREEYITIVKLNAILKIANVLDKSNRQKIKNVGVSERNGILTITADTMADITLECEACHGKRFKQDVLDVEYQGANIYDVLEMTVNQAIEFFEKGSGSQEKKIVKRLKPLQDVGLGYIKLGQTSSTLSGGENQRVKLAYYLGQEKQQPTLFVFDEPTTGLHFHDIKTLLKAFNALIEKGHSVVIIEHNMDVIKCADYVIDLGPEGGKAGGQLVCAGTPEEIAACEASYTGRFLRDKL